MVRNARMEAAARLRAELVAVGQRADQRGLVWGTGGNLSARLDGERFLITAAGTRLDALDPERDLVACAMADPLDTAADRASSEIAVHRALYRLRPDIGAVLHLSPPYATLVACTDLDLPIDLIPESIVYLGRVPRVPRAPYVQPGTPELGDAVAAALGGGGVALMTNHGAVAVGADAWEALRRIEVLEFLARLVVTARAAGLSLHGVGPAADALRRQYGG